MAYYHGVLRQNSKTVAHVFSGSDIEKASASLWKGVFCRPDGCRLYLVRGIPVLPNDSLFSAHNGHQSTRYSLVTLLVNVLEKQKIGYFIIGGTLIGSYRHHDIIPWDDDADIIVNLTDRERLYDALISYKPDYGLYRQKTDSDKPYLWKFFSTNGQKVPFQDFRWPLVDIFFWEENTTHVWNADPRFSSSKFSWPKSHVFPLRKRPLGPIEVNSPCDPHSIIAHTFKNISVCQSRISSHSLESGIGLSFMGGQRRPCHQLDSFTPRVNRTVSHGVTSEKLVISGRVVNTRTFPVMPCEKPG